jgi:catechol 2,3-dioxygenase-like lactoylglutathione lyase family enzyme
MNMNTLGMIAIVVDDYDLAIAHYVNELGFTLIEDKVMSPEKRWVVVAPSKEGARILLAKAANEQQKAAIGNSTGGRVGFFLYTTNFAETYQSYKSKGVEFLETPRQEKYGQVVVFKDRYGNKWDLIESIST